MGKLTARLLNSSNDGEVPQAWNVTTLGEVATLQRGNDLPKDQRREGPYPVVGSSGVVGFHDESIAEGPGVFVGRRGSVGQVSWVDSDYWPLNTSLWVKDFHGNDRPFVYFLLRSIDLSVAAAGVSVPTLNRNLVHPLPIAVPLLPEQRAIARVLRTVQRAKEATETVLAATKQLKQSLLRHLFTYGPVSFDQADQVELKETESGEVPATWMAKRFDEFATLQRGKDLPRWDFKAGTVPVIGATSVIGFHDTANVKGPGVTVLRSGSSVGKPLYVDRDFWAHNVVLYVKDFHGNDPKFVFYRLLTLGLQQFRAGVAVPTLNRNSFSGIQVAVPRLPEQRAIAASLAVVDQKMVTEASRHRSLTTLFNTLLHHLMTGNIRVV